MTAGRQGAGDASGRERTRDLGIFALVVLEPILGYGWVATKVARAYSQPLTFAALRVAMSAAPLFLVMVVTRRPLRQPALKYTLVIGLLQTSAFVGLVIWALDHVGAGKVAVLTYTMPFWLLLLAWVFLGERLRGVQWLAVAPAFAGLVLGRGAVAARRRLREPAGGRRGRRLGSERVGRQAPAAPRARRRALPHHLADGVRLGAADRHSGADLHRRPRVDIGVRRRARLHRRARQHGGVGALVVRTALAVGRREPPPEDAEPDVRPVTD